MRSIELGPLKKTAAALTMVAGIGMAASSGASELQAHHVSESGWTVLGGDPLIQGGVHSKAQVEHLLDSSLGRKVLSREGLGNLVISVIQADAKKGEVHGCTLHFGEKFFAMVFGPGGNEIDYNVTFADPRYPEGAPAFCEDVKLVTSSGTEQEIQSYNILIPQKCGNIALTSKRVVVIKPTTTTTTTTTTVPPTTTTTIPPTTTTTVPPTTTTTIPPTTTTTVKGGDPGIGG